MIIREQVHYKENKGDEPNHRCGYRKTSQACSRQENEIRSREEKKKKGEAVVQYKDDGVDTMR